MRRALLVLALLLCGCTSYWTLARAPLPLCGPVVHLEHPIDCGGVSATGCTWYLQTCAVSAAMDACSEVHEAKHRAGWDHDARKTFRTDCGE